MNDTPELKAVPVPSSIDYPLLTTSGIGLAADGTFWQYQNGVMVQIGRIDPPTEPLSAQKKRPRSDADR